MSRVLH